jgi:hypothetical protein
MDYGYGSVESVSFVSFTATMAQAPFKLHAIKSAPDAKTSLLGMYYWMIKGALDALIDAMNPDNKNPKEFDGPFDAAQRHLKDGISAHINDPDADKSQAARTLFNALLSGKSGTAQTNITLEREVEFGRAQHRLASESPYKGHIALLGLKDRVKAAHDATEALATAIGKTPGSAALVSRSVHQRQTLATCRETFQTIHTSLVLARPHVDDDLGAQIDAWLAALDAIPRA